MSTLALAGRYTRTVRASLARVWENVFDWEHLPSLHARDFAACTLIDSGDWGWRARLVSQPGDEARAQIIELRADRATGRYVVTTLEGPGRASEIRTALTQRAAHETDIDVGFHVPETDTARLSWIGARYIETYRRLWDEDEAMMRGRERALRRRRPRTTARRRRLGGLAEVRARLPLLVTFGGERFRVVELDGALVAHGADCPHWLGPLDQAPLERGGVVRCPWHGYAFDVASGRSCDGRGLRLAEAPRVEIVDDDVVLVRA
jgi:nitrite reductase/ring-hydroxylating ferredoxin subunit